MGNYLLTTDNVLCLLTTKTLQLMPLHNIIQNKPVIHVLDYFKFVTCQSPTLPL
jgi:hypothetical protein